MTFERIVDVYAAMARQWVAHATAHPSLASRQAFALQARDWLFGADRFLADLGIYGAPQEVRERARAVFHETDERLRALAEEHPCD